MIEHIIFDLGNVLVNIHPHRTMDQFAKRCQYSEEIIRSFYLSDLHLGFMAGAYTPENFYQEMIARFPCKIQIEEFQSIWNKVIGHPKPGIEELINQLAGKYHLSICSNTDPWHWQVAVQYMKFTQLFSHFFLSFEMKMNKPRSEVFKFMLDKLSTSGEKCLFIDDTYENIESAERLGFKCIYGQDPQIFSTELTKLKIL
jgi:putative hydrolase of the HAD superfamily